MTALGQRRIDVLRPTRSQIRLLSRTSSAAVLSVAFAACGSDPVAPPDPVPTTVAVTPAASTLTAVGATAQLSAAVEDQNGDPMSGVAVSWTSSEASVATIDGDGLATARADGETTMTATAGQASGTATVTVQQQVASVAVAPGSANLMPTETQQFTATVNDGNGNPVAGATVTWSTSAAAVATVNANGLVTAVADGQTNIIATSGAVADTATVTVATVPPPNQSPSASISSPGTGSGFTQGQTINFAGSGTDPEDGALTGGSLVWESSLDNQIGTGTSFGTGALSIGTHTIRLIATDSQGAADTASISVTVNPNQSPDASISAPAGGASFTSGDNITFTGSATDPEDGPLSGSSLVWESSIDSQIGTGATFGTNTLSVGTHTIRLIATDSQGAADTASISIFVNAAGNQSPSASISAPADGATFNSGDNITFTGSATDPEDGPLGGGSLVWQSSIDNQIGTGETFGISTLSAGSHTIRLIATDSQGAADTASISITVNPGNQAPGATLDTPGDGSAFNLGETVTFRGVATDPEDGPLTGGSLVWRSSIDGLLGTGSMFSDNTLSLGTHTMRLIATDSQGAADTAIATITVLTIPSAMYDVDIRYNTGTTPTAAQALAFANAEARWEQLVLGDVPDVPLNVAAGSCGAGSPAINETIDDLVILVTLEAIDGSGGILGSAGPCFIRTIGNLSILGIMRFDTADLAFLEAAGQLEDVILHEMGHVIGIGSLWGVFGLRVGTGLTDPYFIGTRALGAFENVGGFSYTGGFKVPVANTGGGGTRDAHWRESVFDDELMTGFLDSGVFNPLSIVTVNSLRDMGYVVNSAAADPLFLNLSLRLGPVGPKLELKDDVLRLPIRQVDTSGQVTRTFLP